MTTEFEHYALKNFHDGEDNNHFYKKDAPYPREGLTVSDERMNGLMTSNNGTGQPVIGRKQKETAQEEPEQKEAVEPVEEPKALEQEQPSYDDMNVTELKKIAKDKGVTGYSDLKKGELIALLNDL